jgi:hypothetical protein
MRAANSSMLVAGAENVVTVGEASPPHLASATPAAMKAIRLRRRGRGVFGSSFEHTRLLGGMARTRRENGEPRLAARRHESVRLRRA